MTETPRGEWREIERSIIRKGLRRNPQYLPAIGEQCLMSGPNCDDDNGYTWEETNVRWRDDIFVLTQREGCWPVLKKLEHVLFEPIVIASSP